ncbi:ZIP family metal transporter [Paenibacillus sp. FSL H7-0942]|uniref:ZIP family metal transporter n=1 Tax=Paenibacillus amylolyticus TaxID=1451 RepID=A0ABD8AQV3_PAEAM|nr:MULTISPECIES: ZIP family metal transporter [Paenibacillus]UOK62999.1 ZIP family metal transporter [Paenibacillus sp. OVF10]APO47726.1 ZIP family metal transporter [Paenibacillus xylanexedens]ETT40742.1 metal cation transporter zinc (zn2+)-iron (fe2+) permease (zip) family protein [Paenibacillus sp. FSL R5-192]ETT54458.1 metal cation transporter zinc (zn2+)-iron (fe2+) permease (zip) family protein [Paenibacillus sp. FSL H7-689]KAA8755093.1 ZIP family metal transporter [Paenibacillus sp. UAS
MNDALIGSFISAMSTGLGAVPILFMRKISHRLRDILLAYAAGIMTSASVYNLIPEALGQSNLFVLAFGIMLGSLVLLVLEMKIPHVDLENPEKMPFKIETKAFMIIAAITMHNLPEGLSVGVSYASSDENLGNLIAFSIGLQNAPEGFLVALFLVNQNIGRFKALGIATLTGAVEIITAMIGYTLSSLVAGLVPYGLAFAAGAMMFIVYKELIPESHGDGNARVATMSFLLGLITMIGLTELF